MKALALALCLLPAAAGAQVTDFAFSFDGPFGSYDRNQLQRGLQVYTQVCANCHGLDMVAFRNLADAGGPALPPDQMRAYAQVIEVPDGAGGFRAGQPTDYFLPSAEEHAPDLSLMAKARTGHGGLSRLWLGMGGADYIASYIAGYAPPPDCAPADFPGFYNTVFKSGGYPAECRDAAGNPTVPGSWTQMEPPLIGDDVGYEDGTEATLTQEAQDIAAFLMWAAEPKQNDRKAVGMTAVVFLAVLAWVLFMVNRQLWAPYKPRRSTEKDVDW
ncbi:ubiquinol-cytochrome c reductase cytochrome c1 subunit [Ketogulonicigenium robustum]|uniref:Cytochrome c1 n=1 Tax=Ketogulonicigenium robustum TaxID=92947 RepID=A0A1W6P2W4_9RHOB|nr:cytochrome c1 [Ketogulonicigenium robustum]ARO15763.1 ubiquinol-cytochrome c reductase cytochrome c1 subunit [Ketogulonicigenium robustum]